MALIKVLHKNNKVIRFYREDLSSEDTTTILQENPTALFSTNSIESPTPNEDFSNLLMPHHVVIEDGVARILSGVELASAEASEIEVVALTQLRSERDTKLVETDWWGVSDRTMTQEQIEYRQALRDITETYSSMEEVVWPELPEV